MRLLYKGEMDYPDSLPQYPPAAQYLRNQWDGLLDDVHPLRNALRADFVCLFIEDGQGQSTGYGFIAESPYQEVHAFSAVYWDRAVTPFHDFAHETGHNLGCAHHRAAHCPCDEPGVSCSECPDDCVDNCECQDGACKHSYGYNFPPRDPTPYRTIMAGGFGTMIPHFSNPDVNYPSLAFYPTGVAPPSCNSADNALSINGTSDTIANYRTACDTSDTTWMASHDFFVGQGTDGASRSASMSTNGQYMGFTSDATTFGGQSGVSDIFLYNRESTLVSLISRHGGFGTPGDSYSAAVSGNGRYVAFVSDAGDIDALGADDTNDLADIYVWKQPPGIPAQIRRVSLDSNGNQTVGGGCYSPSINNNGSRVAFASEATNLVSDDTNDLRDIFVRRRVGNHTTKRVSLSTDPLDPDPDGPSYAPSISANGNRYIAFESDATNLLGDCDPGVSGDCNGVRDIFVRDTVVESTFRVSLTNLGTEANGPSYAPAVSADGLLYVFESDATNLLGDCDPGVSGDCNGVRDIFLRDPYEIPPTTIRISVGPNDEEANGPSYNATFSGSKRYVAFQSDATNLLGPGMDTNGLTDVFVRDLEEQTTFRVSIKSTGEQLTTGGCQAPAISFDGRFIAFDSDATDVVPDDTNALRDVFFRDRGVLLPGDFDGDHDVDDADLDILRGVWGPYTPCPSYIAVDLDPNCDIDAADLAILLFNWTG